MADSNTGNTGVAENNSSKCTQGCEHYRRKCKLVSPCCENNYICRFCHNASETHQLIRSKLSKVECMMCQTQQPLAQTCSNKECGVTLGNYFCKICKLYDDEDKEQFHCDGCGLCRVGGRDNYFHCDTCELCLPQIIKDSHKCIEKVSKANCPVCLEDIHTSRIVSHVPPCGHLIHRPCFNDLIKAGFYACPTCSQSMIKMKELWKSLDEEIEDTPMPSEYADLYCNVLCRDCHEESLTMFHVLGHKCLQCGSYNTVRGKGGLFRKQVSRTETSEEPGSPGSSAMGAEGFSDESDKAEH
ncbi:RING finger and CHY zinc finger domain-containing protein 1-like isoform X1 [Homarus americanus]|uniref:RING finger and CHY zinc finger domain-containing protein 1-like n=1 Tax=Homarus americanus TaxID=6706 RepID=A0A8J5JYU3_HOMAM|nr:RING finger and CHY zinc finger domain-containing protein 1-like isoform X1 [Homarus americanus]KAG7163483.1 RING finger and CHY zinc finger domain-containing protein 1-like [Homarus americanus]